MSSSIEGGGVKIQTYLARPTANGLPKVGEAWHGGGDCACTIGGEAEVRDLSGEAGVGPTLTRAV